MNAVVRTSARPGAFIYGLDYSRRFSLATRRLSRATGLSLITHNRWLALENAYRKDNSFFLDGKMAVPLGDGVFKEFAANAKEWGVTTYEQDWLMPQYWGNRYFRNGIGHQVSRQVGIDPQAGDCSRSSDRLTQLLRPGQGQRHNTGP